MERARVAPDAHVEATLRRAGSVGNGAERVADAILRRFGLVDDAEDEDDAEARAERPVRLRGVLARSCFSPSFEIVVRDGPRTRISLELQE